MLCQYWISTEWSCDFLTIDKMEQDINVKMILIYSALFLSDSTSQYLTYQQKPDKPFSCENASSNSALVEHFFNLIFSEFLNHPPVCVCVQMCQDHATYCYPNGCLKKVPGKKLDNRLFEVVPHVHSIKDKGQMTFLVDPQKDFLENYMDVKSVNDKVEKGNDQQIKIGNGK